MSYASILALVLSVLCFVLGITPQPILWVYDNQTTLFTSQFMVPQAQAVDLYYGFLVYQAFLIIVACIKLMIESGVLGREDVG